MYDTFQLTLRGASDPGMTTNVVTPTVWFSALTPAPVQEPDETEAVGGEKNDNSLWRWGYRLRSMPFSYRKDVIAGHDFTTYLALVAWCAREFREITAVTGTDRIGTDGATQFWEQQLADGPIPVMIVSYSQTDPDDDHTWVEIEMQRRLPGVG